MHLHRYSLGGEYSDEEILIEESSADDSRVMLRAKDSGQGIEVEAHEKRNLFFRDKNPPLVKVSADGEEPYEGFWLFISSEDFVIIQTP